MKISALVSAAIVVFQLSLSKPVSSNELAERNAISSSVVILLASGNFQQLEALSADYRTSKSRTSSGLWHLTLFYAGVSTVFEDRQNNPQFWARAERAAKQWVDAYPTSPTAHLSYATMLFNHAWNILGSGYSPSVEPHNLEPFFDYLQQARVYLEDHKGIASSDPYWYELMARIGRGQSWSEAEFSKLISEGMKREPEFYQIYFAAIDYYTPKWGGSHAAIEKFAKQALEQTKTKEGFGLYARIYWYASQTNYGTKLFSESHVDWPTMKLGIDDVLKKYPDAWNINNFAWFACLSHDQLTTAKLLDRIGDNPMEEVWRSKSIYQQCKTWASRASTSL